MAAMAAVRLAVRQYKPQATGQTVEATRAPVKNSTDASESSRGQDSARVTTASPTTISRAACLSCRSLA